jgi:hypothetical protein
MRLYIPGQRFQVREQAIKIRVCILGRGRLLPLHRRDPPRFMVCDIAPTAECQEHVIVILAAVLYPRNASARLPFKDLLRLFT